MKGFFFTAMRVIARVVGAWQWRWQSRGGGASDGNGRGTSRTSAPAAIITWILTMPLSLFGRLQSKVSHASRNKSPVKHESASCCLLYIISISTFFVFLPRNARFFWTDWGRPRSSQLWSKLVTPGEKSHLLKKGSSLQTLFFACFKTELLLYRSC